MDELPAEAEIIRTAHLDVVARFANSPTHANVSRQETGSRRSNSVARFARQAAKLAWLFLERSVLAPDPAILWCPRAIAAGLAAHRRNKFDLIYATGEPYSDYLTALTLSRITGVPFVIDMRDPWTIAPYKRERRSAVRRAIERRQERRVLARCSAAVFANRASDLYAERFPAWASKLHYIPNGYDSADFEGIEPERFKEFTIVHSG